MQEKGGPKNRNMNTMYRSYLQDSSARIDVYPSKAVGGVLGVQLLIWTAGTGGIMTAHSAARVLEQFYYPRIHVESSGARNTDIRSPAKHVANIRDVFAMRMSDLASVLGVTRPTVYAWLSGQEPKGEAVMRIQKLSHAADKFSRENITRLDKLLYRPILEGRSLLDILKENEDPLIALNTLKAIADKEALTRLESKGTGKYLRSLNDVLSDSSVATYEKD